MAEKKEKKVKVSWDSPVETRVRILDHYIASTEAEIKAEEHAKNTASA